MDRLLMGIPLYGPLASKIYLCIYAGPAKTWLLCQVIPYSVWKNRGMLFLHTHRVRSKNYALGDSGMILCMCAANERWRYSVTPSLIGWAHTQYDPCDPEKKMGKKVRWIHWELISPQHNKAKQKHVDIWCNTISHWLGAYTEWSLCIRVTHPKNSVKWTPFLTLNVRGPSYLSLTW